MVMISAKFNFIARSSVHGATYKLLTLSLMDLWCCRGGWVEYLKVNTFLYFVLGGMIQDISAKY